jgi:hypothetical protein
MRLVPIAAILLAVTGCTLIDQTTFAPAPEAKAQAPAPLPASAIDARTPLMTIDYTIGTPNYDELLQDAVMAAKSRYPDVQFDVVAVMQDTSDAGVGQERAISVMQAIMRNRVPADRVHLAFRTDPALTAGRVLVYVR